jgi:dTDP-4-amino-4,6-dideoxygalactose transaminase
MIARYDYGAQFPDIDGLMTDIRTALLSGDYILTAAVTRFEARFAEFIGTRHAIGVNSGTDALVLSLRTLGIGPGDEVITVANTFHASVLAITSVGAYPRLVDCCGGSYLMDLDQVEAAVNPRTRAILAVHLFGKALDMGRIARIAEKHKLAVVEDCAQAVGAAFQGQRVGSFGQVACFSFHPSKNLAAAGDAGAIVTSDDQVASRLRILRGLGQDGQNNHVVCGVNSKLDAIQALVLDRKLDAVDKWNTQRRDIAARYAQLLDDSPIRATRGNDEEHVYHLYQVAVPQRDAVVRELSRAGVDVTVRYPVPIPRQPAFASLELPQHFPNADYQAGNTLCLPIRPNLTDAEVETVAAEVRRAVRSAFQDARGGNSA